jgi:hypothetical protein
MPTAVTATVPIRCRSRTDRPISRYIAGKRPGMRAPIGAARVCQRPTRLNDGSVSHRAVPSSGHRCRGHRRRGRRGQAETGPVAWRSQQACSRRRVDAKQPVRASHGRRERLNGPPRLGDTGDYERRKRQRRRVRREKTVRFGDVDMHQAVHRRRLPTRSHRGGDEAAIRRKRPSMPTNRPCSPPGERTHP